MFKLGQEVTLERSGSTSKSTVRGWNSGGYFLLDIPSENWDTNDRGQVICRLLRKGDYCGFSSSVIGILPEMKIMALKYPEDIVENDFKRGERQPTNLPITICREDLLGSNKWRGIIINISENGCRLLCKKTFEVDEKIFLRGRFPTGGSFEKIELSIKNRVAGERQFVYGGQFSAIDDDEKKSLEKFLKKLGSLPKTEPVEPDLSGRPNIPTGMACQLQVGGKRYNTAIRGALFPKYILLDVPVEDKGRITLPALSDGTVRFLNNGAAYGFESRIVKQYSSPVPLLAMQYPDNIEKINLRKSERIKIFLPGRLRVGEDIYIGAIVDLSKDGCLFTMEPGEIVPDQEGILQVDLPGGDTLEKLPCGVKNVWMESGKTNVGLVFDNTDDEEYFKIRSFYNVCAERLF